MNWEKKFYDESEMPLDRLVEGYSYTSIFRRVAFIGDSLSSGEFETRKEDGSPAYHDMYEYSWGQYIARKNGFTAYNFSRGGMTAKEYLESFAQEKGFWDQDKACQAYVMALGVNDIWGRGYAVEDFLEDYAAIVSRYKEISPDAKFFFVTFCKPAWPGKEAETEETIKGLYALAERFENAYVIDLYQYGPIYDDKFKEKFYLYGHMSPAGYILTAQLIDSYIDYIVRHHPQDFKMAGFIGTGIR